ADPANLLPAQTRVTTPMNAYELRKSGQQALSSAVGAVGILPIVAILVGIVGAAAVFGWRRVVSRRVVSRRRRTADAEQR
ncbi:MAG: hypothetical protein U1D00_32340, partial [Mycobacterium sp.]|nr:hypothetical protein [Mycobacterium sp.]